MADAETQTLLNSILSRLQAVGIGTLADTLYVPLETILQAGINRDELIALDNFFLNKGVTRSLATGLKQIRRGETVSIGCGALDSILKGGVQPGLVTDFFGKSGSGKTQTCFQLTMNACKNGSPVVFIDPSGTFRPERLTQMCESRGLNPDSVLSSVYVARPHSVSDQMRMIQEFEDVFSLRSAKLVVLDGLTENFISEYEGQQGLIRRQSKLAQHLHDLASLSFRAGLPVVVTNTVRTRVATASLQREIESGGNIVAQGIHLRIRLERTGRGWVAHILQPYVEDSTAAFRIGPEGIIG